MASEQVTRYDMKGDWCEHRVANGDWVRYDDYETLLARCEQLEKYVGGELFRSDHRTAADLRAAMEDYRFRCEQAEGLIFQIAHGTGNFASPQLACEQFLKRTAAEAARGGEQNGPTLG
jgi:hypothetical protein